MLRYPVLLGLYPLRCTPWRCRGRCRVYGLNSRCARLPWCLTLTRAAGVDDVSIVPPRARRDSSYEHRPLSSGCWFSQRAELLSNCKRGFPVSRMMRTPHFFAMTEAKGLRPSPGTTMTEMRTGTGRPGWSMVYPWYQLQLRTPSRYRRSRWSSAPSTAGNPSCCTAVLESTCRLLSGFHCESVGIGGKSLLPLPATSLVYANPLPKSSSK